MANDLLVGNKHIPRIYFGNKGVACVYFGNKLIWPTNVQKKLVAQNDNVIIEYVPSSNEEIEHISCFFYPINDNAVIKFKIFHESGLIVAQVTADSIDPLVTELYGLEGQKRTITLNPKITLREGEKYYIQYAATDATPVIKPAYFENINGNYKVYRNTDDKSVADISNLDDYLGYLTTINSFMTSDEDSFMVWNSNNSYNGKLNEGNVYVRNNEACLYYYGDLGNGSFGPTDRTAIAGMRIGEVFRWTGYNGDLTEYNFYRKKKATKEPYTSVTFSNYNDAVDKIAILLYDASLKDETVTPNKEGVLTNDYIWHAYDTIAGKLWTLKSGYSFDYDSSLNRRTSLPDTPVNNCFYLFNNANGKTGLYLYDETYTSQQYGDHYRFINHYSQGSGNTDPEFILYYIVEDDIMDALTTIGQADSFIKTTFSGSYYSNNFRQANLETTKKFYLEIDGREV